MSVTWYSEDWNPDEAEQEALELEDNNMIADTITVNGVEYRRAPDTSTMPIRIVILQRGWVMIGRWSQTDADCMLYDAHVIRRWGTTKGLGELAENGPHQNTKLDKAGTVRFHELTAIATLDADYTAWSDKLS